MDLRKTVRVFVILMVIFCFCLPQTVLASSVTNLPEYEADTNFPSGSKWLNISKITISFSIDGTSAKCGVSIVGKSGTEKITAAIILSRKNSNGTYTPVKTWRDIKTTGSTLSFNARYQIVTGYTYRLTVIATVHRNGVGETVSVYKEVKSKAAPK